MLEEKVSSFVSLRSPLQEGGRGGKGGREGGREEGREGRREGGKKGGREGGREGRREGGKEGGRESEKGKFQPSGSTLPDRLRLPEVLHHGAEDVPRTLNQVYTVLGVDQEEACWGVALVSLPAAAKQLLVVS